MPIVAKKGSELYASTTNAGTQEDPRVDALTTGGYIAVWDSGNGIIRGQRFDSEGAMVGSEIVIMSGAEARPNWHNPEVAVLASGEFVVVWEISNQFTARENVGGQRFAADGTPIGTQFTLGAPRSTGLGGTGEPYVFALPGGGFVVTWTGEGTRAQVFNADGTLGAEIVTGDLIIDPPPPVTGTALGNDHFVLSWREAGVFRSQVFDLSGNTVGAEVQLPSGAVEPNVTALADGGFVIAWQRETSFSPSLPGTVIYAQRFDSNGAAVGAELVVSSAMAAANARAPDVLALAWGGFIVSWYDRTDGVPAIKGQLFGPDGLKIGGVFQINTEAVDFASFGRRHDLTLLASGEAVAVWSNEANNSPASMGIKSQLLVLPIAGTADGETLEGTNGNDAVLGLGGNDILLLQDGGEDTALGGDGNDVLYFGAALSPGDVADGGEGRDAIVLQGNVTLTLTDTNLVGIESISIQSGANATFGDTANNFYDYDVTTANGNVGAGQQLIVNAQSLRADEDFAFDGSAETDGKFLIYGGHGVDDLTGGALVDVFLFEGSRWGPDDKVDGGGGRDAVVISAGNGLTHIEFAADALTSIESISVNAFYATDPTQLPSYEFVLDNGNVAPGGTLIVNGFSLADPTQTISVDGSGVEDGNLILFGGAGNDVLIGGADGDILYGAGGRDELTGGGGADIFHYDSTGDSTAAAMDEIFDFSSGADKVDLGRIDADTIAAGDQAFTWIGSSAFTGSGAASAGELRAVFINGKFLIQGDTDGNGVADLSLAMNPTLFPLGAGDFIL